jgi:hypothetical protein
MSQVLRRHLLLLHPTSNPLIELVKGSAQLGVVPGFLGDVLSQPGAQDSVLRAGAKQGGSLALSRHPIAMGPGNSLDHAVEANPPQGKRSLNADYRMGEIDSNFGWFELESKGNTVQRRISIALRNSFGTR